MTVRILVGHVLERLRELPAESVHCIVTSPPYFSLRNYGIEPQVWGGEAGCEHDWGDERVIPATTHWNTGGVFDPEKRKTVQEKTTNGAFCLRCGAWRGSLGLEPTLDLYLDHLVEVTREVWRVLRADGTCWLNIGDSYNSGTQFNHVRTGLNEAKRYSESTAERWGGSRPHVDGFKHKDLLLVPARLAIRLQEDGWWVRQVNYWCKRAPMPESTTDRTTSAVEWVLHLTKSGDPLFWTHRDRAGSRTRPAPDYRWVDHDNDDAETDIEPLNWRTEPAVKVVRLGNGQQRMGFVRELYEGNGADPGGHAQPRQRWSRINLWDAHDYFYDAEAVKEDGVSDHDSGNGFDGRQGTADYQVKSGGVGTKEEWKRGGKRNLRNFWLLGPSPFPDVHFATFPPRIPQIAILAGTSAQGVCPKCGAPWARVIAATGEINKRDRSRDNPGWERIGHSIASGATYKPQRTATGEWQPTCGCAAGDPVPATVLDPFLGAGTTAVIANKLGRDCIGIELNPEYAEMAGSRIGDVDMPRPPIRLTRPQYPAMPVRLTRPQ